MPCLVPCTAPVNAREKSGEGAVRARGGCACERGRAVRAGPVPSPLFARVSRGAVQKTLCHAIKTARNFPGLVNNACANFGITRLVPVCIQLSDTVKTSRRRDRKTEDLLDLVEQLLGFVFAKSETSR